MALNQELLFDYVLHLADNSMILGQRNAEWCGHGPVLEQDIAMTNIALDLIGEARSLYQYAAELKGSPHTEDSIAFLRDVRSYKNALLVEYPNTDWAYTIVRQFFYDTYHHSLQQELSKSIDERIKSIALKTIKESAYHLKWSSEWMIRLGDGTALSRQKMQEALDDLWSYSGELFIPSQAETEALKAGIGASLEQIKNQWQGHVQRICELATLHIPEDPFMQTGGKQGIHTEHLGYILADMQYLQRAYPGAEW